MNKRRIFICIIFILTVVCGCTIPVQKVLKEPSTDEKAKMVNTYLHKGRYYETKKDMVSAWTQYKLALTVDPQNQVANKNVKRLGKQLRNLAENHFQTGLQFLNKQQYRKARREFLLTLRLWPDHPEAVNMLSIRKRAQAQKYVEHVIKPGESLSKLAKMYYGDYHHFTIIAEYNGIPDPTRVKVGQNIKIPVIEDLPFFAEIQEGKIMQVSKADVGELEGIIKQEEDIVTVIVPDSYKPEEKIEPMEIVKQVGKADVGKPEDEINQEENQEEDIVTVIIPDSYKPEEKIEPMEIVKQVSKADVGKPEDEINQEEDIVTVIIPDSYKPEEKIEPMEIVKQVSKADVGKPEDEINQEENQEEEIVTVIIPDSDKPEEKIEPMEKIKQVSKADVGKLEDEINQYQKNGLISETDWVGVGEEKKNEKEKEEIHEEAEVLRMYLEQGINLFNESKYQEAIVEFNKFVNVNSDNETALEYLYESHFQHGMLLYMKQDYLSAKKEFESSLQYKSDCGKCNEYLKKAEEAYMDFHYVKGISYFREEKLTEALREWELILDIDPEYKGVEQNINKVKTLLKKLEEIQKGY